MIMARLQNFDELNTLSFDDYFGTMSGITSKQKKQRVALAEAFVDILLYAFSLAEEMFSAGSTDAVIESELWDYLDAEFLGAIPDDILYLYLQGSIGEVEKMPVDPTIKSHISLITSSIAATTIATLGGYYATSYERAFEIATSESQGICNYADFVEASKAGKRYKVWLSEMDERTRLAHWKANGQKVKINDHFIVGGEAMKYPHDLNASAENTVNCRCFVRYE